MKRPLLIRPLKKLDDYLLLHKPEIWSARTHIVKWYSLMFMIVLAGLCFINYNDARLATNVGIWVGFIVVIAILALVVWIIYLLRFNVFKRYGTIRPVGRLTTFLLYFIAAGFIVAYSFIPLIVETLRAQHDYNNIELVNDINSINIKICQVEYNNLPQVWNRDSVIVRDSILEGENYNNDSYDETAVQHNYTIDSATNIRYNLITKARLQQIILEKDSIQKLNDSVYILFTTPNLVFVHSYGMKYDSSYNFLTSGMIYNNTLKQTSFPDKAKTLDELNILLAKYYTPENEIKNYVYDEDDNVHSYYDEINMKYKLRNVNTSIDNISNKINRFKGSGGSTYFRFWFYFTFVITLLLFIFRHSTTRTFFLSLLSLIVITILTSLIGSFLNNAAYMFFIWCFFYFVLFSVLGALVFSNKVRSVVTGISINLWMLLVPFLPLLITGYYYERQQEHDMIKHIVILNYEEMHRNMLIAEIAGPLIFCLLLFTYIHKLYRNWYALPEQ